MIYAVISGAVDNTISLVIELALPLLKMSLINIVFFFFHCAKRSIERKRDELQDQGMKVKSVIKMKEEC